ncbi:MAG: gamma carbonic anhydrase family protein [Planctomycetota bacterium]|nr:gamma carbonic anhydrase family protein [Planctomycetota bacterium]
MRIFPDMIGRVRRLGDAFIADTAVVVGDVTLSADVNVWFGVVIRGDDASIEIGAGTNIQDNTVVHADIDMPLRIGAGVTVGHGAILHGIEIGDHSLIGMGAKLLGGSRIGTSCIIGAGAVVAEGVTVPDRSVVVGVPGVVRRQVTDPEAARLLLSATDYIARARSYLAGE